MNTVKLYLSELKANKTTGYDMLPSKLLKTASDILCQSVCYLINMSIKVCCFPNKLKFAEITPLFKKGNTQDVSNYRPVSVLPSLSKIYEKIMVHQWSVYFESIFSKFLSGFRPKHS